MYISDALLLDVDFPEEGFHSPALFSPSRDNLAVDPDNAVLVAALHSLKGMRNDLDAKCNLLVAHFRQQGKDCEAVKVQATCDQQKQGINAEIGKLHDKRGDRRRGPTAELVLYLQGSFDLTLTQSGKVLCHYWEVPSSGDPVLIEYWVEGNETKTLAPEYLMIVSTEDQNTGKLQLRIGYEMEPWGINTGFYIITGDYELSTDELNNFWVD